MAGIGALSRAATGRAAGGAAAAWFVPMLSYENIHKKVIPVRKPAIDRIFAAWTTLVNRFFGSLCVGGGLVCGSNRLASRQKCQSSRLMSPPTAYWLRINPSTPESKARMRQAHAVTRYGIVSGPGEEAILSRNVSETASAPPDKVNTH